METALQLEVLIGKSSMNGPFSMAMLNSEKDPKGKVIFSGGFSLKSGPETKAL